MPANSNAHHAIVDALFDAVQKLALDSPSEDFDAFGAFFDEDCTVYLKNMISYDSPSVGRQATINALKENLKTWNLEERRVVSRSSTEDGLTVICEMRNRLQVLGEIVDPFFEMAVVVFNNNGLITELRQHSCRSPIISVVQDKTGVGPYAR